MLNIEFLTTDGNSAILDSIALAVDDNGDEDPGVLLDLNIPAVDSEILTGSVRTGEDMYGHYGKTGKLGNDLNK